MLQQGMPKKKKPTGKSSKEILAARNKGTKANEQSTPGRPTKYPRTTDTKRMNIFIPGELHGKLRIHAATLDVSMNQLITDCLITHLGATIEQIKKEVEGKSKEIKY